MGSSSLLPSEISRLVFGYLGSVNCSRTKEVFLEENSDLQELSILVSKKLLRSVELELDGHLTLVGLLNESFE